MRLWPLLPWKDKPERIYSFIWRIAEFTAMGMVRNLHKIRYQETDLGQITDDDGAIALDADEQVFDGGIASKEAQIDLELVRSRFSEKLARVGWPDGMDPAQCDVMKQPGPKFRSLSGSQAANESPIENRQSQDGA
jgi:hypothetical protein